MVEIVLTAAERESGQLTEASVQKAIRAIREEGFVVLKDAVAPEHVQILREQVLADVQDFVNRPDAPFNWVKGNVQQDPPPFPPFLFRDVLANEFVIQITHQIMGDGVFNSFYSGNTALPSGERQPVHADQGHLWPNLEVAHPPYALVINLPLVDMSSENGSTEIWPGSHLDTSIAVQSGDIKVSPEKLDAQRKVSPPIQPTVSAGSLLIRDMRLWHAGMPNHTEQPRPMLAMIHNVAWWPTGKFALHPEAESLLSHPVLRQHADYSSTDINYKAAGSAYEFVESK